MAGVVTAEMRRKSGVLALYRATLKQVSLVNDPAKRQEYETKLRAGYREKVGIVEATEVKAALKDGFGRLGFLRTITPRIDRRARDAQKQKETYRIQSDSVVAGVTEKRRPIKNVINDSPVHDVDAEAVKRKALDHHFMGDTFWKDTSKQERKWVPSMCRPLEDVLSEASDFHKDAREVEPQHRQVRNRVGSRGVWQERAHYKTAPWDVMEGGSN